MKLHYKELGEATAQPLLILHGVFGSLDNWQTLGREFAKKYRIFLIDQRNHGRSPHDSQMDYPTLANDLFNFIEEHQLQNPLIIGHSMGGKVVMEYALTYPTNFDKLVIVDIAARKYNISHHEGYLKGLRAIHVEQLTTRGEAEEKLAQYIDEADIRLFLLKNLGRNKNGFEWKINIDAIEANIDNIGDAIGQQANTKPCTRPTLFISGGKSRYIQEKDMPLLHQLFPNSTIHTIENAGHWVHAEAPKEFFEVVNTFLAN